MTVAGRSGSGDRPGGGLVQLVEPLRHHVVHRGRERGLARRQTRFRAQSAGASPWSVATASTLRTSRSSSWSRTNASSASATSRARSAITVSSGLGAVHAAEQERRDLRRGGEPPLPAAGERVQPGVVNGDTGGGRQSDRDLLIVVGELVGARFSARYRLPNTVSRMRTGTPRKLCIGGWLAGKPYDWGCLVISGIRTGRGSSMSRPSTPRPVGSVADRRGARTRTGRG